MTRRIPRRIRTRSARSVAGLLTALVALVGGGDAPAPASPEAHAARAVPTEQEWLADVHTAVAPAKPYLRERAAEAADGERLAINLDIDNTVLATYYGGGAIPEMLRLTKLAQRHGIAVLFNTGRATPMKARTLTQLQGAGYQVDGLCLRRLGETLVHGKQRCRDQYADAGWTLVANIGNRPTDFTGTGYERAFRLPDYGGVLG